MPIRPKIKSFGYSTMIYGFSNLLTKIVAVTLIPLYTNYLSVYEVGVITLLEMIELFIVTIIPVGSVNAMWRYLPKEKRSDKNKIIISSFIINLICGAIFIGTLFFFKDHIASILNINSSNDIFLFVLLSCFLRAISNFIYWLLQYKNLASFYLILSLTQFISLIFFTIYFIVFRNYGVIGIYYSKVIVFVFVFLFTIVFLIRTAAALPSGRLILKLLTLN